MGSIYHPLSNGVGNANGDGDGGDIRCDQYSNSYSDHHDMNINNNDAAAEDPELQLVDEETRELLLSLSKTSGWRTKYLYLYRGFWCQPQQIQATLAARAHYVALDSDVVITTVPKSGTTWLKALVYAIVRRAHHPVIGPPSHFHPLLTNNPHDLVPFLEYKLYINNNNNYYYNYNGYGCAATTASPSSMPRLVASHLPYDSLPDSIKTSHCKIVYICRNPLDTFVSIWHFMKKMRPKSLGPFTVEEAFDKYCNGEVGFGPYWDHMLAYWRESHRSPHKVIFFKYDDLRRDSRDTPSAFMGRIKALAHFLGFGFSHEEDRQGVVNQVANLCSFDHLKGLQVNRSGNSILQFDNNTLFRKGEVGDWANHLTQDMVDRLNKIMDDKLAGTGLEFH